MRNEFSAEAIKILKTLYIKQPKQMIDLLETTEKV